MRGNIYDRNGYVIAQSRPSFLVVLREQEIMEKAAYVELVEKLEKILKIAKAALLKKLKAGGHYALCVRRV